MVVPHAKMQLHQPPTSQGKCTENLTPTQTAEEKNGRQTDASAPCKNLESLFEGSAHTLRPYPYRCYDGSGIFIMISVWTMQPKLTLKLNITDNILFCEMSLSTL